MIDIHCLVAAWHVEVIYETLPEEIAAVYQPKSENQPAKILLQKQRPFTHEEIRELLAMGLQFLHLTTFFPTTSDLMLFLDSFPTPGHMLARDLTAMLLIELEELSRLLHAGIDDIVTLAEKFGCRKSLLEHRLSMADTLSLWDNTNQTYRQIVLHRNPVLSP